MLSTTNAAVLAAGAADQRRQQNEEQQMAIYPADLDQWEFKIIRSNFGAFGVQEKREEILAKEAEAQWQLLEVFDNARIRLRRPINAKELDGKLDFDPYRTNVDLPITFSPRTAVVIVFVVGLIGAAVVLAAILESL